MFPWKSLKFWIVSPFPMYNSSKIGKKSVVISSAHKMQRYLKSLQMLEYPTPKIIFFLKWDGKFSFNGGVIVMEHPIDWQHFKVFIRQRKKFGNPASQYVDFHFFCSKLQISNKHQYYLHFFFLWTTVIHATTMIFIVLFQLINLPDFFRYIVHLWWWFFSLYLNTRN